MQRIAILFTCFNRKEKSLSALKLVFEAYDLVKKDLNITIYLTDDGSTDGTGDAVRKNFPKVKVLQGTGELYWAGGMRNSWKAAIKGDYDAYLLMNDDTEPYPSLFTELLQTHSYCLDKNGVGGVYVGSTLDKVTNRLSYGGSVFTNRFLAKYKKVIPNGVSPQECELGNANILLTHKDAVIKIGILSEGYIHGMADFDYTLKAVKKKVPVYITPNFLGNCTNDHSDTFARFSKLSLKERKNMLLNPVGLDFKSHLQYMKSHFPYRLPIFFLMGWFKVLFPKIYIKMLYKR